MAKLTDKQKRYAAARIAGNEPGASVLLAGYKAAPASVKKIAFDNEHEPRIAAMIAARTEKALAKAEVTRERITAELAKLAFGNQLDYIKVSGDGTAYVDLSALTRDQAAAIQEITIDEYTEGRGEDAHDVKKIKIKLADKRAALVDLGKDLGMFVERKVVEDLTNLSPEERKRRIDELVGKRGD